MLKHLCTAFGIFFVTSLLSPAVAEENSDWFRHSAISPDGSTIVFSYKGDIYNVSAKGGRATALTIHSAWEATPFGLATENKSRLHRIVTGIWTFT